MTHFESNYTVFFGFVHFDTFISSKKKGKIWFRAGKRHKKIIEKKRYQKSMENILQQNKMNN